MIYIGLDPGLSGGIGIVDVHGRAAHWQKMPATDRDLFMALKLAAAAEGPVRAMIEKVGVMPGQGIVSAFTFGRNVGAIRMALIGVGIPFDEVQPAKWQLLMGCRTGGDKNISKRRAQELFPDVVITHAIADALLLAEYCRRMQPGSITEAGNNGKEEGRAGARKAGRKEGGGKTGRQVSAAETRTAVAGAARHGAGPKLQAR